MRLRKLRIGCGGTPAKPHSHQAKECDMQAPTEIKNTGGFSRKKLNAHSRKYSVTSPIGTIQQFMMPYLSPQSSYSQHAVATRSRHSVFQKAVGRVATINIDSTRQKVSFTSTKYNFTP
jgi:hypothetical protein